MAKTAKRSLVKKEVVVDLRKVKELQRLLKVETEGEAVRMAIEESVANLRMTRSYIAFWMRWPKNSLLLDREPACRFLGFHRCGTLSPLPSPSQHRRE